MKIQKPFDTKNMHQNKLYFYFSDPAPKTDKALSCHRRKVALSVEVVFVVISIHCCLLPLRVHIDEFVPNGRLVRWCFYQVENHCMMLLFLSMMRWTNPSQPTSSKLKVESKICFFEFCQFQSGIGPPPQSRLLQKMSGKKSTNRVRRLSVRENRYNWDHFQCRATREEGNGCGQAGWVTIKISNNRNPVKLNEPLFRTTFPSWQ